MTLVLIHAYSQAFKIDDVCPGPDSDETQEGKLKRLKQFKAAEKRANARCYAFVSDTVRLSKKCVEDTKWDSEKVYVNPGLHFTLQIISLNWHTFKQLL